MQKKIFLNFLTSTFATFTALFLLSSLLVKASPAKTPSEEKTVESSRAQKAANFILKDNTGKEYKLSDFRGKVVFLNFFATWCPYCTEEIPELSKLHNIYKKKNFVLISINIQESSAKVKKFTDSKNIKYTVLLDTNGKAAGLYHVRGIPTNALVDKKGNLRFLENTLPETSLIDSLLKEK